MPGHDVGCGGWGVGVLAGVGFGFRTSDDHSFVLSDTKEPDILGRGEAKQTKTKNNPKKNCFFFLGEV